MENKFQKHPHKSLCEPMNTSHSISFKNLFQELYPDMVKIALFYVHDLDVAEDITQEIFAKLWEKRKKLDSIENTKGYLSYAIKNRCLNYLEHQHVVNKYQQEYLQTLTEDDSTEEFIQKVSISLNKLPPKRRKIVEMSIVDSKSYQEIATEEEISINTVKDHIKKAYAFLRKDLYGGIEDFILFLAFSYSSYKTIKSK